MVIIVVYSIYYPYCCMNINFKNNMATYKISIKQGSKFNEEYFMDNLQELCTRFGDSDAVIEKMKEEGQK